MRQEVIQKAPEQPKKQTPNLTGIPTQMKLDFERRSGLSFDDVRVHYNSDKPRKIGALAYTQIPLVHIGPGQERHLRHELGHVVQQKQGIVRPTDRLGDLFLNTDETLEQMAEQGRYPHSICNQSPYHNVTQCFTITKVDGYVLPSMRGTSGVASEVILWDSTWEETEKRERIRTLSSEDMDRISVQIITMIARTDADKKEYLNELKFIVRGYNCGEATLPQGKNLENAPTELLISVPHDLSAGGDVNAGIEAAVKRVIDPSKVVTIQTGTRFIEDSVEFLKSNCVATRIEYPRDMIHNSILTGRTCRGWKKKDFIETGDAAAHGSTAKKYADCILAARPGARHSYRICPIEGGNMLAGSDFIIVGKDSLYATMGVFKVDESEAKALIAYDFGIAPERVFPVEQPGEYHLDMSMLLLTDRVVLLGQSEDCQKQALIAQTMRDLQGYGFDVLTDPIFVGPTHNFLNGEFIKGDAGKIVFLTNAPAYSVSESELATKFRTKINEILAQYEIGPIEVVFIQNSLDTVRKAGLACRMKGIGA